MVRLFLKEQGDAANLLAQQQAAAFKEQFEVLRVQFQATRGLLQARNMGGGDDGSLLPRSMRLDVPKFPRVDLDSWIFAIT